MVALFKKDEYCSSFVVVKLRHGSICQCEDVPIIAD